MTHPLRRRAIPEVPRAERLELLRNPDLWLANGCAVAGSIAAFGVPALSPHRRQAFDLSTTEVGLLLSILFLAGALFSVPAGHLIDRAGAAFAVATGELLAAAGFALAVATSRASILFAGMAVLGVGYGIISPASTALASLEIPANQRGFAIGIRVMGQTLGGAFAGLALPILAEVTGWRATLVLPVTACLGAATVALLHRRRRSAPPTSDSGPTHSFRPALRRGMWSYGYLMSGLQLGLFAYIPLYLIDEKGLSVALAAIGYFIAFFLGSAGRLLWGIYSDALGSRLLPLSVVAAGSAVAFLLLPLAPGALVLIVLALAGATSASWNGVFQTAIVESAGRATLGHELGLASMFLFAGGISGPLLIGVLEATIGWRATWFGAGAVALALGVALWGAATRNAKLASTANI